MGNPQLMGNQGHVEYSKGLFWMIVLTDTVGAKSQPKEKVQQENMLVDGGVYLSKMMFYDVICLFSWFYPKLSLRMVSGQP